MSRTNRLGGLPLELAETIVILSSAPIRFMRCPMWTAENRPRYNRDKLRYPSDLTDAEWALIEPLAPAFATRRNPAQGMILRRGRKPGGSTSRAGSVRGNRLELVRRTP